MTKTTVYLGREDYRRLQAMARRQNRTTAELIRQAVADYAKANRDRDKPRSIGAGHSGRGDLSECAEELLVGIGR